MRTFADSKGREWHIDLTVGEIKRIRSRLGVDLLCLLEGDPPLVNRLRDDLELILNLVYAAIEPQAEAAGVDDIEFGQSLDGPTAAAAIEAMWGAVLDFFRPLRLEVAAAAERVMILRQLAAQMLAEADAEQAAGLGEPSTEPQEPLALTPTG